MSDLDAFLVEYRDASREAGRLAAEVRNIEDQAKIALSQALLAAGEIAVAKAEHAARASEDYRAIMGRLYEARSKSEAAKADADWLLKRWETWRTKMATHRARMQQRGPDHASEE